MLENRPIQQKMVVERSMTFGAKMCPLAQFQIIGWFKDKSGNDTFPYKTQDEIEQDELEFGMCSQELADDLNASYLELKSARKQIYRIKIYKQNTRIK